MRYIRIEVLIALALAAIIAAAFYDALGFIAVTIYSIVTGFLSNYLWNQYGRRFAYRTKVLVSLPSREEEIRRIEAERARMQWYRAKPEELRRYTLAVLWAVLGHWGFAGALGVSATLPTFLGKLVPGLEQSMEMLDVVTSWSAMLAYVMFLLGVAHGFRLWRVQDKVANKKKFEDQCEDKLSKLKRPGSRTTTQV